MKPTEKTSTSWRDIFKNAKQDGILKTLLKIGTKLFKGEFKVLQWILIGLGTLTVLFITYKIYYKVGSLNSAFNTIGNVLLYGLLSVIAVIVLGAIIIGSYIYWQSQPDKKTKPIDEKPTVKVEEPGAAPSSDKDEENTDASPSTKKVKTLAEPKKTSGSSDSSDLMKKISELFEIVANVKFWGAIIIAAILCMIIIKGKGCGSGCNGFRSSKNSKPAETPTVEQLARTKDSLEKVALQKLAADSLNQSIAYLKKFNKTMDSINGNYPSDNTSDHNQEANESKTTQKSSGSGSWRDFFSFSGIFSKWKGATASPSENQRSPERATSGPTTSTSPSGSQTNTSSSSYTTNESTLSAFEKEMNKPEHWNNNLGDEAMQRYLQGQNQGSDIMRRYESGGMNTTPTPSLSKSQKKYLIDPKTGKSYYYNADGEMVWANTHNQNTEDDDALRILEDVNSTKEEFDAALGKISH